MPPSPGANRSDEQRHPLIIPAGSRRCKGFYSGNLVHSLRCIDWSTPDAGVEWNRRFDDAALRVLLGEHIGGQQLDRLGGGVEVTMPRGGGCIYLEGHEPGRPRRGSGR